MNRLLARFAPSPLVSRILQEHRQVLWVLSALGAANVLLYFFALSPLAGRVNNVSVRNEAAAKALSAARQEHGAAVGALAGKDRATTELATFYTSVLPQNLPGARRLTHLRIAQMASEHGLHYARASSEPEAIDESTLTQLKTDVSLSGPYSALRSFLAALEASDEFVVIDNVKLSESNEGDSSLQIALTLVTYYRSVAQP